MKTSKKVFFKDEGENKDFMTFGKVYVEENGQIIRNCGWQTLKYADNLAKMLNIELERV